MFTLIIIILSFILAIATILINRRQIWEERKPQKLVLGIVIGIIGIIIGLFQPFVLERVDAGHVGIEVNLTGGDRGVSKYEYKTGWLAYNNWTEMFYEFPTYQQHIEYDTISVITKGGFMTKITPSFNYALIPDAVGDMFVNLRKPMNEVEQGWLKNAIYSSINDVANQWAVDSIFNAREQFESAIIVECNKRVAKWFVVSQLRSNIIPPPALQSSIEAKTKAVQEVQVAENRKKVAQAEALTNVATAEGQAKAKIAAARGDSATAVINANGQAEAIRIQQKQLTPLYIEYIRASNWDGKYPTTMLGSASPLIQLK